MSTPHDFDDVHARALDDLTPLAFGEPADPQLAEHIAQCAECSAELASLTRVVELGRSATRVDDTPPPPEVWDRIVAELAPPAPVVPLRERPPRRRWLLAAAAVVAIGTSAVGGWVLGHRSASTTTTRTVQAALQAMPGTDSDVTGTAAVHRSADGYRLDVRTQNLAARNGYYEVWLYDPKANIMVAVGTLGTGGRGSFTVPGGLDLTAYHVVDVSAQNFDGDASHGQSVLRGPLTT